MKTIHKAETVINIVFLYRRKPKNNLGNRNLFDSDLLVDVIMVRLF
jgi:hypothetical protein